MHFPAEHDLLPSGHLRLKTRAVGPKDSIARRASRQSGIGLVQAIFILVVFSALGVFMVSQFRVQNKTTSLAQQGIRAYYAAQSGLEWGLRRALVDSSCQAGTQFQVGLFQVSVNCTQGAYQEGGQNVTLYSVSSLAEFGHYGQVDHVSRRIETRAIDQ